MISLLSAIFLPLLVTVFAASGCTPPPRILSQWTNPDYIPLRKAVPALANKQVMVIAISRQESIRRNFEDAFVARLRTANVKAVPSYRSIKDAGPVPEERLKEALEMAGADVAIMTRLVAVEEQRRVSPGFYRPRRFVGIYDWYSWGWRGYYEPPRVYRYDVFVSETSVYDLATDEVLWTGTVRITDPRDFDRAISGYIETIMSALAEQNLIRAGETLAAPAGS